MYQKIYNLLKKHTDKVFHFTAGAIIYLLASISLPAWIALAIVLIAGLAKEVRDQIVYKGFDWKDWLVTAAGGAFVLGCLYLKGM